MNSDLKIKILDLVAPTGVKAWLSDLKQDAHVSMCTKIVRHGPRRDPAPPLATPTWLAIVGLYLIL